MGVLFYRDPTTGAPVPLFGTGEGLDQAAADTLYVNVTGDTMTGPLSIEMPSSGPHAANKQYVDAEIAYANRTYTHTQSVLSTVWNVVHNLGKHPIVQAEDNGGTLMIGTVHHIDNNSLTITFAMSMTGRASCS